MNALKYECHDLNIRNFPLAYIYQKKTVAHKIAASIAWGKKALPFMKQQLKDENYICSCFFYIFALLFLCLVQFSQELSNF